MTESIMMQLVLMPDRIGDWGKSVPPPLSSWIAVNVYYGNTFIK